MSPELGVTILMSNYFHDVATALLLACGIALRIVLKKLESCEDGEVTAFFARISKGIHRLAGISLAWIVLGGIVRVWTFRSFEWANAVEKHHESGLIAKYIIAGVMTAAGAYLWQLMSAKAGRITAPTKKTRS